VDLPASVRNVTAISIHAIDPFQRRYSWTALLRQMFDLPVVTADVFIQRPDSRQVRRQASNNGNGSRRIVRRMRRGSDLNAGLGFLEEMLYTARVCSASIPRRHLE